MNTWEKECDTDNGRRHPDIYKSDDYDIFNCFDLEEAFAYPDVYPDCFQAEEISSHAKNAILQDEFLCKLDKLYRLQALTVNEEKEKYAMRNLSNTSLSTSRNRNDNGTVYMQYPKNKGDNIRSVAHSSIAKQIYPRKVISTRIEYNPIRIREVSVGNIPKVEEKTRMGNRKAVSSYNGEVVRTHQRPASFKEFSDMYIRNANSSKPVIQQYCIPRKPDRVKTAPSNKRQMNSANSNSYLRTQSTTRQVTNTNSLVSPALLRLRNAHKQNMEILRNRTSFINEYVTTPVGTITTNIFSNCRGVEKDKDCNKTICDEEYGDTEEERAIFAVTLPRVSEHYKRHMRDPLYCSNVPRTNTDGTE